MKTISNIKQNPSTLNRYFDKVYVLNLERRTDRKIAMLQKLNYLGIEAEFIKSVDGYSVQNIKEHNLYLNQPIGDEGSHPLEKAYQKKLIKSPGAWGCLKTFLQILKDAKKNNYERILCFEDDVIFHKDFANRFQNAVQAITNDWKLLYLGASQYVWEIPGGLRYPNRLKKTVDSYAPFYHPNATDGAFAIGIHHSVFDLLISEILKMNCPFDSGALRTVIAEFPKKCFVLTPNLVIADVSESDIRGEQNQASLAEALRWNLEEYDFPFEKDLVSVIMPAYNAENTIEKSIRSILMQTYETLEIIIVDDASTDQTATIVKKIIEEDGRIRLVSLAENIGVGGARNEGLKVSRGKIIAFQDADDISLKNRIEKQIIPIYQNKVLFSVSRIIRSRCTSGELDISNQHEMMELVQSRRKKNRKGDFEYADQAVFGLVNIVYQRKVFEEFGLFENYHFGEDLELLERILFFTANEKFNPKFNGHSLLNYGKELPDIFQKIDEVLLVCSAMNANNLTTQYEQKNKTIQIQQEIFRKKYKEKNLDLYQKLPMSIEGISYNNSSSLLLELKESNKIVNKPIKTENSLGRKTTTVVKRIHDFIDKMLRSFF